MCFVFSCLCGNWRFCVFCCRRVLLLIVCNGIVLLCDVWG